MNFSINFHIYYIMVLTLDEFLKKYNLYQIDDVNKVSLLNDISEMFDTIFRFIEFLIDSNSKWTGDVLFSAIKLNLPDKIPPIQTEIAECIQTRDDNLSNCYKDLEEKGLIKIEKKGRQNHILLRPDKKELKLISELVNRYWRCRNKRSEDYNKWV